MTVIRSKDNAHLQRARAARAGRTSQEIVLEGERLIEDARAHGVELLMVLVADDRVELADRWARSGLEPRLVDAGLLRKLSALTTAPGSLALARAPRPAALEACAASPRALVLAVGGVGEPGNLGALARSAEAAGASALCLVSGGVNPWNEKALRGSMGSLLRLPVCRFADAVSAGSALARAGFRIVRARTRGGTPWQRVDWSGRVAVWVGSETGTDPDPQVPCLDATIPMAGSAESLNVTVAAALLLFAADRVRAP
jgi:TrmH family RNA methyltransferase